MNDKKLFIKNSLTGVSQKLLVAILTFFTIPVFISRLGTESYGIFATISVIGDLTRIANIGFHIALIKYLSLQGKTKESSIDIVVGLTGMIIIIVPISALMLIFNNFVLLDILNISPHYLQESKSLYNFLVLSNMLLFIGLTFSAMLESQKYIYKVSILQLVYSVCYWSFMLIVLFMGKGIETIGKMAFLAALIWFLLIMYMALKMWGKFQLRGIFKLYKKSVKKQLSYGLKVYSSGLMGLFGEPLIKVLVANFFGSSFVGFLDIGIRIRNQLARIIQGALWPLFQLFSSIKDKQEKARIAIDFQEKTALIILPLAIMLIFGANPIVTLWIGENIDIISLNIIFVVVSSLIGTIVFNAFFNYISVDHPLVLLLNGILSNIIYVGVVFGLKGVLGYNSVFLALSLMAVANIIFCVFYQYRFWNKAIFDHSGKLAKLLLFLGIISAVGYLVQSLIASPILLLATLSVAIPIISLGLYISLSLITPTDVDRYLGKSIIAKPFYYLFKIKNKIKAGE